MNSLMHDAINKFHNINLRCGMLALELEPADTPVDDPLLLKRRLEELLTNLEEDFRHCRRFLTEIYNISSKNLDSHKENEHFFKVLEPILSIIDEKRRELENIINKNKSFLLKRDIIRLLHVIEEKALASGVILKELRSGLIKSGIYKIKEP